MKIRKIYVDMDGVLANFDRGVEEILGLKPLEQGEASKEEVKTLWKTMYEKAPETFYKDLKPLKDAYKLLTNLAREYPGRIEILTGLPNKKQFPNAADQKREWFVAQFGWDPSLKDIPVNTCMRKDKIKLCTCGGDILIDDYDRNIKEWEDAGGEGIHHTDMTSALTKLHKIERMLDKPLYDNETRFKEMDTETLKKCIEMLRDYRDLGIKYIEYRHDDTEPLIDKEKERLKDIDHNDFSKFGLKQEKHGPYSIAMMVDIAEDEMSDYNAVMDEAEDQKEDFWREMSGYINRAEKILETKEQEVEEQKEENMAKYTYVGMFTDYIPDEVKGEIEANGGIPGGWKETKNKHVTLEFLGKPREYEKSELFGKQQGFMPVKITDLAISDKSIGLLVEPDFDLPGVIAPEIGNLWEEQAKKQPMHITIANAEGVKPVETRKLWEEDYDKATHIPMGVSMYMTFGGFMPNGEIDFNGQGPNQEAMSFIKNHSVVDRFLVDKVFAKTIEGLTLGSAEELELTVEKCQGSFSKKELLFGQAKEAFEAQETSQSVDEPDIGDM